MESQTELEILRRQLREEQRRREAAETRAEVTELQTRSTTVSEFLEDCHKLSLAIQIVTDPAMSTSGNTTKPTNRLYPQRILPCDEFPARQQRVWENFDADPSFSSQRLFASSHQLDYVRKFIDPISAEMGLRQYERDAVENPVRTLVEMIYNNELLRCQFQLRGTVTFESHMNLGQSRTAKSLDQAMQEMSVIERTISGQSKAAAKGKDKETGNNTFTETKSKVSRSAKGQGGCADQFCVYKLAGGERIPALAVEYKAPHKLNRDEIIAGLDQEIEPAREVINKEGDGFAFYSKRLVTAVVTQLFSYMIAKGLQYGYICTGEVFIFLYIPDDPIIVYYSLCVPNLDVKEDDHDHLHQTAVAQVLAFTLRALSAKPPSQSWHDATARLEKWEVEYTDVLNKIPETNRKEHLQSVYKSRPWRGPSRSPIRLRSRCRPILQSDRADDDDDDADDDDDMPSSPTPNRDVHPHGARTASLTETRKGKAGERDKNKDKGRRRSPGTQTRVEIKDRQYCTQLCLRGLSTNGSLDMHCPNFKDHQGKHLTHNVFLRLIRRQLAEDRGPDADCTPLYIKGSRGALFKVRLSSHGYTLVAKGMESFDLRHLQHEGKVYRQLHSLQGVHVPVCLGAVNLVLPYYYDGGQYTQMLFLSWAGTPICRHLNPDNKAHMLRDIIDTVHTLHRSGVLHGDVELRNILWNEQYGRVMMVDFERAKMQNRKPLGIISPNERKRKKMHDGPKADDEFSREVRGASTSFARYVK